MTHFMLPDGVRVLVRSVADVCLMPGQAATEASDLESYFCSHLRLMPLGNIDPSLAIGFYCRTSGEARSRAQHSFMIMCSTDEHIRVLNASPVML